MKLKPLKSITLLRSFVFFAPVCSILLFPNAHSQDQYNDLPHYAFLSGELLTEFKGAPRTVAGSKGRKMLFEDSRESAAFSTKLSYQFTPFVALSDSFVEISEADLGFSSIATTRREERLSSDMQAIQEGANSAIAQIQDEAASQLAAGQDEAAADLQMDADNIAQDTQDIVSQAQASIDEGMLEKEGFYDIFYANFKVTPHQDIENAYAALVMSYDESDPLLQRQGVKKVIVRTALLGNLNAGVEQKFKVSKSFVEQKISGAELEVYLFSSEGEPIATSRSGGLKQLTADQLKRWRELESKES